MNIQALNEQALQKRLFLDIAQNRINLSGKTTNGVYYPDGYLVFSMDTTDIWAFNYWLEVIAFIESFDSEIDLPGKLEASIQKQAVEDSIVEESKPLPRVQVTYQVWMKCNEEWVCPNWEYSNPSIGFLTTVATCIKDYKSPGYEIRAFIDGKLCLPLCIKHREKRTY